MNVDSDCISKKLKIIYNNNDDYCSNTKTAYDSEANCYFDIVCDNESDSNSNLNLLYNLSNNSNIDNECTAELKKT